MIRLIIALALALLVLVATPVESKRRDCGNGLPCGPIPWQLPVLPRLASPTPFPTLAATFTPTPSPTPTATLPPSATPPSSSDLDIDLDDQIGTLQAIVDTTPEVILDAQGTPVNAEQQLIDLSGNVGTFFSYAKGLSALNFGALTPLILFGFTFFVITITTKLVAFVLPFAVVVFGIIRKIIQLVLDFLPF